MIETFDETEYQKLLIDIAPRKIETEVEYDRLLEIAEWLTFAKNMTPEQRAIYKLLVRLIEDYETEMYGSGAELVEVSLPVKKSSTDRAAFDWDEFGKFLVEAAIEIVKCWW